MALFKNKELKQISLGSIFAIIILALMIFMSEITGEKEIIFPEVAAFCVGSFILPHVMWKSAYYKMVLYIALCAVLGVLIVKFLPIPLWIQFTIGFIVAQLIFFFSQTGLAPMISAMVLPVLIQTESPIYIISAISLTLLVVIFTIIHSKFVLKEPREIKIAKIPPKEFILSFIYRVLLSTIVVFLCTNFDLRFKFTVAPPLLVAFTEMTTNKNAPSLKRPVTTIMLFILCAFIGAASRFILTIKCKIPLTISAIITTIGFIVLMKKIKLPFPPAAAMGILAMLIPEEIVLIYTLEVAVGISIWTIGAVIWKNILWRGDKEKKLEKTVVKKSRESTIKVKEEDEDNKISIEIETINSDTDIDEEQKNNNNNKISKNEDDIINIKAITSNVNEKQNNKNNNNNNESKKENDIINTKKNIL